MLTMPSMPAKVPRRAIQSSSSCLKVRGDASERGLHPVFDGYYCQQCYSRLSVFHFKELENLEQYRVGGQGGRMTPTAEALTINFMYQPRRFAVLWLSIFKQTTW